MGREILVESREKSDECDAMRSVVVFHVRDISGELSPIYHELLLVDVGDRTSTWIRFRICLLVDDSVAVVARSPDIFLLPFSQTGLVLGVYETESEDNVVLTPTAAKYNELVNGKLLKSIQL